MCNRGCSVAIENNAPPGLLNLNKPAGMTSRDVVNQVVRALRRQLPKPLKLPKAGHAGTLDPMASGVLVVGVGAAVRLVPYLHQLVKRYRATFRLGQSSVSGDLETPLVAQPNPPQPSRAELLAAASRLVGHIQQTPPAHSAVKVDGRKAYKFAHRGQAVEVPQRTVWVESLTIDRYASPEVDLRISCGSGTYIRTLGIDLAAACGCRAVMTHLVRTHIGHFSLDDAIAPQRLMDDGPQRWLHPLADGVRHLPAVTLDDEPLRRLANGVALPMPADRSISGSGDDGWAVFDRAGNLWAIARPHRHQLRPYRVFRPAT